MHVPPNACIGASVVAGGATSRPSRVVVNPAHCPAGPGYPLLPVGVGERRSARIFTAQSDRRFVYQLASPAGG